MGVLTPAIEKSCAEDEICNETCGEKNIGMIGYSEYNDGDGDLAMTTQISWRWLQRYCVEGAMKNMIPLDVRSSLSPSASCVQAATAKRSTKSSHHWELRSSASLPHSVRTMGLPQIRRNDIIISRRGVSIVLPIIAKCAESWFETRRHDHKNECQADVPASLRWKFILTMAGVNDDSEPDLKTDSKVFWP